jgi:cyclophilin family peptidyl-prolyl cis-trans isomerase
MTRPKPFLLLVVGLVVASSLALGACSSGTSGSLPTLDASALTPSPSEAAFTHPPISPSASAGEGVPAGCPTSQPASLPAGETRTVTVGTPKGTIVIKIDGSLSPIAAGNFVALAQCGYYDGVVFHRLVPGFVIQGGDGQFGRSPNVDPQRVGTGGPGYTIKDEPVTAQYGRGVVAMARTSAPDSQGSQFFIVLDDAARDALQSANTYAIIGHVTAGMDVVDAIAAMPNSGQPDNAALDPVPMTTVSVTNP